MPVSAVVARQAFVCSLLACTAKMRPDLQWASVILQLQWHHACNVGSELQAGHTEFDILALFGYAATAGLDWSLDTDSVSQHTAVPSLNKFRVILWLLTRSTLCARQYE